MPEREPPALVIMPVLNCWRYTSTALSHALNQTLRPDVLVVDNGSTDETRDELDHWSFSTSRLHVWHHDPPLPSLSATWNTALHFAWDSGYPDALVVNNDVELFPETYAVLRRRRVQEHRTPLPLFVTGIGVKEADFRGAVGTAFKTSAADPVWYPTDTGGPDFSCFLITRLGHTRFAFDEGFIPAYHEDNDLHRRYQLANQGDRIFGCAVPFLHWSSRTVNQSKAFMQQFHEKFQHSMDYYVKKWGGPVGQEQWEVPFNGQEARTRPRPR